MLTAGLALGAPGASYAENLGVIGPVHPIAEPSLLEVIREQLTRAQADGTLQRLQREAAARVRRAIEQPAPVASVHSTREPRSFLHDPSLVVDEPITDAQGRVLVAPGKTINPLAWVSLREPLLFLDAREREHLQRARELITARGGRVRLILTGGSPLALMRRWERPVFHDQGGWLTAQLGIRQVPALVTQEGLRLRIDEIR
jgi:conjugal transfer pilus assembly protein TraW